MFLALGIIKKAHLDNKKPAFLWRGVEGLNCSIGKLSDKSTASELSKEEKTSSPVPEVDFNQIIVPRLSSSFKHVHDTPATKFHDDFKLSSRSAFRLCKLFISTEKENFNFTPQQQLSKLHRDFVRHSDLDHHRLALQEQLGEHRARPLPLV